MKTELRRLTWRIACTFACFLILIGGAACKSAPWTEAEAVASTEAEEKASALSAAAQEQAEAAAEVRKALAVDRAAAEAAAARAAEEEEKAAAAEAAAAREAAAAQEAVAKREAAERAAAAAGPTHRVAEAAEPCLNFRSVPVMSSKRLECLTPGSTVKVLDQRDDWNRVQLGDGRFGWMTSRFLEPIEAGR